MNAERAALRHGLGCILFLAAPRQMRVPADRDYRTEMKKSLKLSPGFAQKTAGDTMPHATLLFSFVP